jgi:hypothetical protein
MKRCPVLPRLAPLLALLAAACADPPARLAALLPPGVYRAELFTVGVPAELSEVQQRFNATAARKAGWYRAYVAAHPVPAGRPLPWDAQMGITRPEYDALVAAFEHPSLLPQGATTLEVTAGAGAVRLRAPPPHEFLDGWRVDGDGRLHAPGDLVVAPEQVRRREARFGTWSGLSWHLAQGDLVAGDYRALELSVGRAGADGRLFVLAADAVLEKGLRTADHRLLAWLSPAPP